ncbi:uncharacterized protein [Arachis hypogaea]|uniref:uncharacterized protein n=1 Tax=Arachis hypogaea TaxID=3818 RepID=UPI003B21F1D9
MVLDLKGNKFTWFSNPRNGFITKERIDRVLVNWQWRKKFQHAVLEVLPAISSDHCPLMLTTSPRNKTNTHFKYEAFRKDHEECCNVINKGWNKEIIRGTAWTNIIQRMKNCKEELRKWSRTTFKRADKEILKMKEELRKLQNSSLEENKQQQINQIKRRISKMWRQEEKYWGQRSRLKWLKWGDKNTTFFHATTIQRKDRNRIERLKNSVGQWVQGGDEILKLAEEHFPKLFTSEKRESLQECIRKIPRKVTNEMNEEILGNIRDDEIRAAAFSLGGLKAPGLDGLNGMFYQKH